MDQSKKLIRLAVFGSPIKHSLSPRIHLMFAQQAGLNVEYEAIEASEEFLSREIQKLADQGGTGCNITLPLKNQAFRLANRHSERAELSESANTLSFKTTTRWRADSTDGPGLLRDLTSNLGIRLEGQRVCIIGAGGAAAGILYDLLQQQPSNLTLFNRTLEKAELLAEKFVSVGPVEARPLDEINQGVSFDLVINATSSGHHRRQPALSAQLFGAESFCYDLNYGVAHESTRNWCHSHEVRCADGLGMLIEQAADSFQIWTGFRPDTKPVHETLRTEL